LNLVVEGSNTAVVLAEDHPVYREGLRRAIAERPDLRLVGVAADGASALEAVVAEQPDVALMDLRMPGISGEDLIAAIGRDAPATRVLVLSASQEPDVVFGAITAGASGYLSKDASRSVICDAVAALGRGESVVDPRLQAGLVGQIRGRGRQAKPVLTPREHEILVHVAEGLTAAQIGAQLYLSAATIKSHLSGIYQKLGVPDRSSAVAVAIRQGLLQ
jgi:two-component system nitrate/nitrite response regulator NarL